MKIEDGKFRGRTRRRLPDGGTREKLVVDFPPEPASAVTGIGESYEIIHPNTRTHLVVAAACLMGGAAVMALLAWVAG